MRCVVLTTDTLHHRYFVNRIALLTRPVVVLEASAGESWGLYWRAVRRAGTLTALIDNPYLYRRYRRFNRLQDDFERAQFFRTVPADFSGASDVVQVRDVNSPECLAVLDRVCPTLVVSFGTRRIGRELLGRPGLKINIHRGILPQYRGLDSDLWACFFRDFSNIGTSVHVLESALDTGALIDQRRLTLTAGIKIHHLRYHTTLLAVDMVEAVVRELVAGRSVGSTAQDRAKGRYYSYMSPVRRVLAARRFKAHIRGLRGPSTSTLQRRESRS